ncbi:MAG: endonuclease Q family protein [Candidatus Falkowbacteria bacterium]|nr:endonuclease Q family protein [Candidatus Falkowbacteria bacterium]
MKSVLDLHIHSKYSRACSPQLTLSNIEAACRIKGIDIIATGDFTYPAWFKSIEEEIEEIGNSGLYKLKSANDFKVKFILSTEVALIYKDGGKARRVHIMITAPNIKAVRELNKQLDENFNIRSDGRPILGMSCPDLVKLCLAIDPKFLIYPAHIWTPWFSMFGSKSGFNTIEECFHEQAKHIYAYETGLSSDPAMNWQVSQLDNLTLLSSSDAHSLANLAREANVFDLNEQPSYEEIYNIIKNHDTKKILYTIEFWPEEGMYHFDGHRDCNISFSPKESKKHKNICPVCGKELVIGVLNRVMELAGREEGIKPKNAVTYKQAVELDKIICEAIGVKSRQSTKVQAIHHDMIKQLGSELKILLDIPLEDMKDKAPAEVIEGIKRMRANKLYVKPGFDGQYGVVQIFSPGEKKARQKTLL